MAWSELALQFCLELAFGVLLALAFVPKAPVGRMFYRLMGTTAVLPVLVAVAIAVWVEQRAWYDPIVLASFVVIFAYPFLSAYGGSRHTGFRLGLGSALVGSAVAVALCVQGVAPELTPLELGLATASALATGAVAGSVGLAMVLGHWYLTVPKLEIDHLRRLNAVTVVSMLASIVFVSLNCLVFGERLSAMDPPLFGATGLFYLGTRVAVGLVFPLVFAAMAQSSLRFQNTRSATGILYASTILVLIGTAVSVSLQDSYGIPL